MIWLKGLLNPYVILAVVIASLFGLWKYEKHKTAALKAEVAIVKDEKAALTTQLKTAAGYTKTLKLSLEMQAEDAEIQAKAADQARAKERLAWIRLDKLKKEINSATDNPPIPDALERVLDAYRVRSAVPGDERPDSVDGRGDTGEANPPGPLLPDPAAPSS